MRLDLDDIPELPAEGAEMGLRPRHHLDLPLAGGRVPLVWCESGHGRPVLLLPEPFASVSASWGMLTALPESLRALLVETVPLVDAAVKPPGDPTLDSLSKMLGAVMTALELERPLLVCEGALGLAALHLTLDRPASVAGLVLIDCSFEPRRSPSFLRRMFSRKSSDTRAARSISRHPVAQALAGLAYADPAVVSRLELRERAEPLSTVPGALSFLRWRSWVESPAFAAGLLSELRARAGKPLPVPLRLLFGERGAPARRAAGEEVARGFPGAEVFVAEQSSHSVHAEKPPWTARIIAEAAGLSPRS
ncbi:MAG: alpha/beta hydrolase [Myxococcales bacterium]|nr:alpha/beta hydrolase [Myxococcales bacterium]